PEAARLAGADLARAHDGGPEARWIDDDGLERGHGRVLPARSGLTLSRETLSIWRASGPRSERSGALRDRCHGTYEAKNEKRGDRERNTDRIRRAHTRRLEDRIAHERAGSGAEMARGGRPAHDHAAQMTRPAATRPDARCWLRDPLADRAQQDAAHDPAHASSANQHGQASQYGEHPAGRHHAPVVEAVQEIAR